MDHSALVQVLLCWRNMHSIFVEYQIMLVIAVDEVSSITRHASFPLINEGVLAWC